MAAENKLLVIVEPSLEAHPAIHKAARLAAHWGSAVELAVYFDRVALSGAPFVDKRLLEAAVELEARMLTVITGGMNQSASIAYAREQVKDGLAALDEQADLSDEQWDEIDDALDVMNDELRGLAEEFAGSIQDGQEPSRREAMLYAADTLDVLLSADDAIYGSLSDEQRANVEDEAIDPMAHIDPGLLDVFMELDRQ